GRIRRSSPLGDNPYAGSDMTGNDILVVEDEEAIAEAVRARLASEGYRVRVAHDGPQALQANAEERPDLVVLDLMLPGMDGLEFEILLTLARSPGVVFGRDQLMDKVWGYRDYAGGRVVDSHVARIRRKLGDEAAEPRYIRTVHGVGYAFREDGR